MRPDYKYNDPRGWCGDPSRGAALGRDPINGPPDFAGKLAMVRVYLDSGGYDKNGTYYGHGDPIYWYADADHTIDETLRARSRTEAKAIVRERYPNARFYR